MRRTELLHSLTVKLTETFPALRQAGRKKRETGRKRERDRPGCLPDAAQHVDTAAPFSHTYTAHSVENIKANEASTR